MDDSQEAAIAADLQNIIKKHFPGIRSMVVVKAAYDAIKPLSNTVHAVTEKLSSVGIRALSGATGTPAILCLPSEVKCRIWELCVLQDNQQPHQRHASRKLIRIGSRLQVPSQGRLRLNTWVCAGKDAVQPAITRVCRDIRQDALQIFYNKNHFVVQLNNSNELTTATIEARCFASKWFLCIGPENSKHLKHVYWSFGKSDYYNHDIDAAQALLKKYGVSKRLLNEMDDQLSINMIS